MGSVIVVNWVTLDGVMQGPGREGEDPRDGFAHSGWGARYSDPALGAKIGEAMGGAHAWLFGRWSYEDLLASWNERGGPFRDALNDTTKYVASSDAGTELRWPNSTLLTGDVMARVAALKTESDTNLVVMGSGVLTRSLAAAGLVDRYLLMVAPLVLGTGRRLFGDGAPTSLVLRDCTPISTGAVALTYEPAAT